MVRKDSELFYLHPGVIPVGPVVPGLIRVSSREKTSWKIPVPPGGSLCPPGVFPVFPDELGPPRYGAGVFPEDPGCGCITELPGVYLVLFIFLGHGLYFYIII